MSNYGSRGSPQSPATHAVQGTLALVGGLASRNRGSRNDGFASMALIVLGAVAVATIIPGLGAFTLWLMGLSAFGLIAFGVWRLWQYSRSRNTSGGRL